jgi:hypothetical protein
MIFERSFLRIWFHSIGVSNASREFIAGLKLNIRFSLSWPIEVFSVEFNALYRPLNAQKGNAECIRAVSVGNRRLGAMVFGSAVNNRLQFNEDTPCAGGP